MGLGKTLQMIAFLLSRHEAGFELPNLVVCPASLVYNWMSELSRFAPNLRCCAVVGPQNQRRQIIACSRGYDVLVTSYELLKRDIDAYAAQKFSCQVLDEAQYIKNASTQAARCTKLVDAQVRFALTGTPIENRLTELWSIFDYLMPGLLGSVEDFHERFEEPISLADEDAAHRLQCMVGPFILRRLKGDVLKDLPEKNESVVYTGMDDEQRKRLRAVILSTVGGVIAAALPGLIGGLTIAGALGIMRLLAEMEVFLRRVDAPQKAFDCLAYQRRKFTDPDEARYTHIVRERFSGGFVQKGLDLAREYQVEALEGPMVQ